MVANFDAGGAAINVLAEAAGASVRVVDIAVDADEPLSRVDRRAQGAPRQRQHRGRGRVVRRRGGRGDRGRPPDRRRRSRLGGGPVDRRRYGHRKYHGGNHIDRRADRLRTGRGRSAGAPASTTPAGPARPPRSGTRCIAPAHCPRIPLRCSGLRRRRCGRDGRILRSGRGAPHAAAARRRGRDRRRAGGRPARAGRPAVVAGGPPVAPSRPMRSRCSGWNSNRSSICGCGSARAPAPRSHCPSCGPRWPHWHRWPRSTRPDRQRSGAVIRRDPFGHRGIRVRDRPVRARSAGRRPRCDDRPSVVGVALGALAGAALWAASMAFGPGSPLAARSRWRCC